ncbi:MAG: hypothetical protein ORN85_08565, partial [Sediminibacterium sp.]|nr:hypothetical protein [Sediminibacterium sp.]
SSNLDTATAYTISYSSINGFGGMGNIFVSTNTQINQLISTGINIENITNRTAYRATVNAINLAGDTTSNFSNIVYPSYDSIVSNKTTSFQTTTSNTNFSSADYITLPTLNLPDTQVTIMTWFKLDETLDNVYVGSNRYRPIFSLRNSSAGAIEMGLWGRFSGVDSLVFFDGNQTYRFAVNLSGFSVNQWNHYGIVINRVAGQLRAQGYINGIQMFNNRFIAQAANFSNNYVGGATGQPSIVGRFEDFRMYQLPLQPSEILSRFNTKLNGTESRLYVWQPLANRQHERIRTYPILNGATINNLAQGTDISSNLFNVNSTITSQNNTGARWYYDTVSPNVSQNITRRILVSHRTLVAGQQIQYSLDGGITWSTDNIIDLNTIDKAILLPNTFRCGTVRVRIISGNIASPTIVRNLTDYTVFTVPDTPRITAISGTYKAATVNFNAPVNNGCQIVTGYNILVYNASNAIIASQTAAASPIVFNNLTAGQNYRFRMVASNNSGSSDTTNFSNPIAILDSVTLSSVVFCDTVAAINFSQPVGSNIQYSITASTISGGDIKTQNTTSSPYYFTNLISDSTYYFTITASLGTSSVTSQFRNNMVTPRRISATLTPVTDTFCLASTLRVLGGDDIIVVNGGGNPFAPLYTYRWYYKNNPSNAVNDTLINGALTNSYIPAAILGTQYYYIEIGDSINGASTCTGYRFRKYLVANQTIFTTPVINAPNASFFTPRYYCVSQSGVNSLSITTNDDIANSLLRRSWYYSTDSSTNAGSSTLISGAITNNYLPTITTSFKRYYYVIVNQIGSNCQATSAVSGSYNTFNNITFNQQGSSREYCSTTSQQAINVNATEGRAAVNYQWYINTSNNNSTGISILNANSNNYTPNVPNDSQLFYYVIANLGYPQLSCNSATSQVASIRVYGAPASITTNYASKTYCVFSIADSIQALVGIPTRNTRFTYQWYSSEDNIANVSNDTLLSLQNNSFYKPSTSIIRDKYYFVVIKNGPDSFSSCVASSPLTFISVQQGPQISTNPNASNQNLCLNGTAATALNIVVNNGGTPQYNWFRTTDVNRQNRFAVGTNMPTYTPPNTQVGSNYYFVVIRFSGLAGCTDSLVSQNSGLISVFSKPSINAVADSFGSQTLCQNTVATRLITRPNNNGLGTLTYSWYRSNNSVRGDTDDTAVVSNTSVLSDTAYRPSVSILGTLYYYAIVNNGSGVAACQTDTSIISGAIQTILRPVITLQPRDTLICNGQTINLVTNSSFGTSYTWRQMKQGTNTNLSSTNQTQSINTGIGYNNVDTAFITVVANNSSCSSLPSGVTRVVIVGGIGTAAQISGANGVCNNASLLPITVINQVVGQNGGGLKYVWYQNAANNNTSGTLINNVTSASYSPMSTPIGTIYYYAILTQDTGLCSFTTPTYAYSVYRNPIADSINGLNNVLCQAAGLAGNGYRAYFRAGSNLTFNYQWFQNNSNSQGDVGLDSVRAGNNFRINNSTDSTTNLFRPSSQNIASLYFKVRVTDGNGCIATSDYSSNYQVVGAPTINSLTSPGTTDYCLNQVASVGNLNVSATSGGGTLTYLWYRTRRNDTLTQFAQTFGGNSATQQVQTSPADTSYYFVKVSQSVGNCATMSNQSTAILVYARPVLNLNTYNNSNYCQFEVTAPLTITPSFPNGNVGQLTYTWFDNGNQSVRNAATAVVLANSNSVSYAPLTNTAGIKYYYAVANNGGPNACNTDTSALSPSIIVYNRPSITNQPNPTIRNVCQNVFDTLRIIANGNDGVTTYQWFSTKRDTSLGFRVMINEATSAILTIPTSAVDSNKYFVVIANNSPVNSCKYITSALSGNILVFSKPTISAAGGQDATYCKFNNINALNVTANVGNVSFNNTPTIQGYTWLSNSTNSRNGATVVNTNSVTGTANSYTPSNANAGVYYIFAVVRNSFACFDTSASAVATITINAKPIIASLGSSKSAFCQSNGVVGDSIIIRSRRALTGEALSGNNLTFYWYKTFSNTASTRNSLSNPFQTNIRNDTSDFYNILLTNADSSYYIVVVQNGNNCYDTSSFTNRIEIASKPVINTVTSANRRYCQNVATNTLNISYTQSSGSPIANINWYRNISGNRVLVPGSALSYTPTAANLGLNNYYITYNYGTALCFDSSVILGSDTIYALPTIVNQPSTRDTVSCVGAAKFTRTVLANANGGPNSNLTYQWFQSLNGAAVTAIASANSTNYTPATSTPQGLYQYRLSVRNNSGISGCDSLLSNFSGFDSVYMPPTITVQPVSAIYCKGRTVNPMMVTTAAGFSEQNLTYQWFVNTVNSVVGAKAVVNSNSNQLLPRRDTAALLYYFVVVRNQSSLSLCNSTTSTIATITINDTPTITPGANFITNPPSFCFGDGSSRFLRIMTNAGVEVVSGNTPAINNYSWYQRFNNIDTIVQSRNVTVSSDSLNYSNFLRSPVRYYVIVTNNLACNATSDLSGVISSGATPVIQSSSVFLTAANPYCQNYIADSLKISQNLNYTYTWYRNTMNSKIGGTLITGQTNYYYIPSTTDTGTVYYYVIASLNGCDTNLLSGPIVTLSSPLITQQPNLNNGSADVGLCQNASSVTRFRVRANSNSSTVTVSQYDWFKNNTNLNRTNATIISGNNTDSLTPIISSPDTQFYYVVVSNNNGCQTTSNYSPRLIIRPLPNTINIGDFSVTTCQNYLNTQRYSFTLQNVINYQWYSSPTNSNFMNLTTIADSTGSGFTPSTNIAGTNFYVVIGQNSFSCTRTSNFVGSFTVNPSPQITSNISNNGTNNRYCQKSIIPALNVTGNGGSGTLASVQWFRIPLNNSFAGSQSISGATNQSYVPSSNRMDTALKYYFLILTNTNSCVTTSNISNGYIIDTLPTPIVLDNTTQPNYCQGSGQISYTINTPLNLGSITYQWYQNTVASKNGATLINGATLSNFTPSNIVTGTYFYFVVTTNPNNCSDTSSFSAAFTINPTPTISSNLSNVNRNYCVGSGPVDSLRLTASGNGGTISGYQWFKVKSPSVIGGISVQNSANSFYLPSINVPDTSYYFVVVSNVNTCNATSAISGLYTINPAPLLTLTNFVSAGYCLNSGTVNTLSVSASNATFAWIVSTTPDSTSATSTGNVGGSFTPPNNVLGTRYYYVVATATGCITTSRAAGPIIISNQPTISSSQLNIGSARYCKNGVVPTDTLRVSSTSANISYQWYYSRNATVGSYSDSVRIPNATDTIFIPRIDSVSSRYYFVRLNNGVNGTCQFNTSAKSNLVRVDTIPLIISNPTSDSANYCQNAVANAITTSASAVNQGINLQYQWYFNTTNSLSGASFNAADTFASITPLTTTAGTIRYYFVVISNGGNIACRTATSNISGKVSTFKYANTPTINNAGTQTICANTPAIRINISNFEANVSYQWFSNSTAANSGGSSISGATDTAYTISNTNPSSLYYYVVGTFNNLCPTTSTNTGLKTVIVAPVISINQSLDRSYCRFINGVDSLQTTVIGSHSGFNWYKADNALGNNLVLQNNLANNRNILPTTDTAGVFYYYVTTSNVGNCVSNVALSPKFTINQIPTITITTIGTTLRQYCQNTLIPTSDSLRYNFTVGNNSSLSFVWFSTSATTPTNGTSVLTSSQQRALAPSTAAIGIRRFYASVTDALGCADTSNEVSWPVQINSQPTINLQPALNNRTYCQGVVITDTLFATLTDSRVISAYTWFDSVVNVNAAQYSTNPRIAPSNMITVVQTPRTSVYYVIITDNNNCSVTSNASGQITINPNPTISENFPVGRSYCQNQIIPTSDSIGYNSIVGVNISDYTWFRTKLSFSNGGSIYSFTSSPVKIAPSSSILGTDTLRPDTSYYYLVVSTAAGCNATSNVSNRYLVRRAPRIISPTTRATSQYCQYVTQNPIITDVISQEMGTSITNYQWFKSKSNIVGSGYNLNVSSLTSNYIPLSDSVATVFYYFVAQNNSNCFTTSNIISQVTINAPPSITTEISQQNFKNCINSTNQTALSVSVTPSLSINYDWYRPTVAGLIASSDTLKQTGTNNQYIPSTARLGEDYYYVIVTSLTTGCKDTSLQSGGIITLPLPSISSNLDQTNRLYTVNDVPVPLSIRVSSSVLSNGFRWFYQPTNTNFTTGVTAISADSNKNILYPNTTTFSSRYYFVVATDTNSCSITSRHSGEIAVTQAATITIINPGNYNANREFCIDGISDTLRVTATIPDRTALTYRWYRNSSASTTNATALNNTDSFFIIPTANRDTSYYFVVVTNIYTISSTSIISGRKRVNGLPTLSYPTNFTTPASICVNSPANLININVTPFTSPSASLLVSWFQNNSTFYAGATPVSLNNTTTNYTPQNSVIGTSYYYAVITEVLSSCVVTSNFSGAVNVNTLPIINNGKQITSTQNRFAFCYGANSQDSLAVTVTFNNGTSAGSQSWFRNSANSFSGAVNVANSSSQLSFYQPSTIINNTTYYYTIVTNNLGCSDTSLILPITIQPKLTVTNTTNSSIIRSYCQSSTSFADALSISVSPTPSTINYQLYTASSNNFNLASAIGSPQASNTFFPALSGTGIRYNFIRINYGGTINNTLVSCFDTTSLIAVDTIILLPSIVSFTANSANICQNTLAANITNFSVVVNTQDGSQATYQWQDSISGGSWSNVFQATNSTYKPTSSNLGISYYRVRARNTYCFVNSGSSGAINIIGLPTISANPNTINQSACINTNLSAFRVTARDVNNGSSLSYQWLYRNDSMTATPNVFLSEINDSVTPLNNESRIRYYQVIITNNVAGNNCFITSNLSGGVFIYDRPSVNSLPTIGGNYCVNLSSPTALTTTATLSGIGSLSYNWYSNTVNSTTGGTLLASGTTLNSYTPDISSTGRYYYYVEAVNLAAPNNSACKSRFSNISTINNYSSPIINTQIATSPSRLACQGNSLPSLFVAANNGGLGNLTYSWYMNNTNSFSGAILLNGFSDSFYTPQAPSPNDGSARYYFVVIRNNAPTACDSIRSSLSASYTFNLLPSIDSSNLNSIIYCQNISNQTPLAVFGKSNNGNALTHKWVVRNTLNGTPTDISRAVSSTYSPPTNVVGTFYYQDTIGNGLCFISSPLSGVIVVSAGPVIATQPALTLPSSCFKANTFSNNLTVTAQDALGGNSLTYTWFRNAAISTTNGININQFSNTISPIDSLIGTNYYYVVVGNNTADGNRCVTTSNISGAVNVYSNPTISYTANASAKYCYSLGQSALTALAVSTFNGGLGLTQTTWFVNKSQLTTGGDSVGTGNQWFPRIDSIGRNYYYARVRNLDAPATCNTALTTLVSNAIDVYRPSTVTTPATATTTYCANQISGISPINVSATNGGYGSLTYQWYINSTNANSNGTAITVNGNNLNYIPLTSNTGTFYYYIVVKNGSGLAACDSVLSAVSPAILVNTIPRILTQSSSFTSAVAYCRGTSLPAFSITADNGSGGTSDLSYRWFISYIQGVRGDTIRNQTSASYSPVIDSVVTIYYQINVYNLNCSTSLQSSAIQINPLPTIITQLDTTSFNRCINASDLANLSINVRDVTNGTNLSYSWFNNSSRSVVGATAVTGTTANLAPLTNNSAASYYFVIITNLTSGNNCVTTSNFSGQYRIYMQPSFSQNPSSTNQSYCVGSLGSTGTALSVTVNSGLGTNLIQWRRNAPTGAIVGTGNSYLPRTDTVSRLVYFAIVTNTDPNYACPQNSATSNSSGQISVYGTPSIITQPLTSDTNYCLNQSGANPLSVIANAGIGTLSYQWFSNTTQNVNGSTMISTNGTSQNYTPLTSSAGTLYYYVIIKNQATPGSGCDSIVSNFSGRVNIYTTPIINSQTTPTASYCRTNPGVTGSTAIS